MNIGFIAHDNKKTLMQNFCVAYHHILSKHDLCATGTTGRRIEEVTNLHIKKFLTGSFGEQQLCAQIDNDTIDFFKEQSEESGIPYQTLINLYLSDCAKNRKRLQMSWE